MKTKLIKLFIVLVLLTLVSLCFAAWDNDKPADSDAWNTAAGSIRANWDALETIFGVDLAGAVTAGYENVKSSTYGATGDGVTDDATALQAAFDSGGSVIIPEGVYITNTPLTWTTDYATLMFVSHNSIIKAGPTFPLDNPIIHFAGGAGDKLVYGSIYNLHVYCESRSSGILLTYCGHMSFYSPTINSNRNGIDNYAFDIIGTHGNSGSIWVHGLHIYGSDESGGIRLDGDGFDIHRCGFWGSHMQHVGYGIHLKARCHGNHFEQMMIDITYNNAAAFGIKEEAGVTNYQNIFSDVIVENTFAAGTGIDMQATDSYSTCWDYWIVSFSTASVFDDLISQKYNYRIDGVNVRSRARVLVLHGAFNGYSPDATMTWGSVRSTGIAGDSTDDTWDFLIPLPHRSIINTITNEFSTDDGNADLKMQVWKQSSALETWVQVGGDHDYTGDGPHTATIDYEIEQNFVVKVSILAKRGAGTFLYVYPLNIKADY